MRLVKAAKASPHAKFYNLSTAKYGSTYNQDSFPSTLKHVNQILFFILQITV